MPLTTEQRIALKRNVAAYGYCKTAELIRKLYNESVLNLRQARLIFRTLRREQFFEVGTISANLWRI